MVLGLEVLERLLGLLAILDEEKVLFLELRENVEQLLRLFEVHGHLVLAIAVDGFAVELGQVHATRAHVGHGGLQTLH